MKFKAEMIGPDGASDSMWVQIKGTGSRLAWHTGQTSDWGWPSADSPEVTAPAGNSVVQFYGREKNFKVRSRGGSGVRVWVKADAEVIFER